MKIAKLLRKRETFNHIGKLIGHQYLYKLSEPLEGNDIVVCSAVDYYLDSFMIGVVESAFVKETYIFPADEDGEISDWGELDGSMKDVVDPIVVLENLGYKVYHDELL